MNSEYPCLKLAVDVLQHFPTRLRANSSTSTGSSLIDTRMIQGYKGKRVQYKGTVQGHSTKVQYKGTRVQGYKVAYEAVGFHGSLELEDEKCFSVPHRLCPSF